MDLINRTNNSLQNSVTIRIAIIGVLALLLLIPAVMIENLIHERQSRLESAVWEVSSKWGNEQTITGPIVTVPYDEIITTEQNNKTITNTVTRYAHFLPNELNVEGSVTPEIRKRGIYQVIVYSTSLAYSGNFSKPDFSEWNIDPELIQWEGAFISIGIPDMRGIEKSVEMDWDGESILFNPGVEVQEVINSGISSPISLSNTTDKEILDFSFNMELKGSSNLNFIPLGRETRVNLSSNWPSPSFDGAFIPDEHSVTQQGFTASWEILHLNRNYPQKWRGESYYLQDSKFGVNLIVPVDQYQKTYRAVRYAIMVIGLTFMVFFFVEVLNKKRIHPIQYVLIGLALVIFYTLLLALSEHISFDLAYLISAVAVIALIMVYIQGVLKTSKITRLMAGMLVLIYGFIYTTLQLQDYALLLGSLGLFIVLALVMYFTRQIDWYQISMSKTDEADEKR